MMNINEIQNLHPTVRIAGYLARNMALAECGAKLRTVKEDEEWTEEEEAEWDRLCDELDPWFYALTDAERELMTKIDANFFVSKLARGENVL